VLLRDTFLWHHSGRSIFGVNDARINGIQGDLK
jgi:hypothetical protein